MEKGKVINEEKVIRNFCNSYVPSRSFLCGKMPEGKAEPQAPYCLLPHTWRDYDRDPSITEVQSCKGKECELKEAICPMCARG